MAGGAVRRRIAWNCTMSVALVVDCWLCYDLRWRLASGIAAALAASSAPAVSIGWACDCGVAPGPVFMMP